MHPSTRVAAQNGVQQNASFKSVFSMMNFGLAKAIRHSTAETVRMNRQRPGRMLSAIAEIQSAMILTAMVQLPSTLIGIMNRKIPTTEGTMNRALLTFFSIIIFSSLFLCSQRLCIITRTM